MNLKGVTPLFDRSVIDGEKTTADFTVGVPIRRETVFSADMPWENGRAHYMNVVFDGEKYRGYYISCYGAGGESSEETVALVDTGVCYIESEDGFNWSRPMLRLCEINGSLENNVILRSEDKNDGERGDFFDNFFVFFDTNPACKREERFKALAYAHPYKLSAYVSEDGIRFTPIGILNIKGKFDSNNLCYFDKKINKYVAYIRDFHGIPANGDLNAGIRDARRSVSDDFINWSEPELIKFPDSCDYPIYTSQIMPYYRNPDILIGFPTRYCERTSWTDNFDKLCGKERRKSRLENAPHTRIALTVTDCIFMASRDGVNFYKCDEAFITPGPEYAENWIYGNCYPAYFMKETASENGTDSEISMLVGHYHTMSYCENTRPDEFVRYTVRKDGFAFYQAKYSGARVVTKPFVFEGKSMRINFSTSAKGSVYIVLRDNLGNEARTCELFGDSTEREVSFEGVSLSDFCGREVTLEFEMRDAKIYSFEIV